MLENKKARRNHARRALHLERVAGYQPHELLFLNAEGHEPEVNTICSLGLGALRDTEITGGEWDAQVWPGTFRKLKSGPTETTKTAIPRTAMPRTAMLGTARRNRSTELLLVWVVKDGDRTTVVPALKAGGVLTDPATA